MKKSEIVRNMIRDAKVAGMTGPDEAFITSVMEATGHPRQLARAYIKNNWPRVVLQAVAEATEAAGAAPADGAEPPAIELPKAKRGRKAKAKVEAVATAEAVDTAEVVAAVEAAV